MAGIEAFQCYRTVKLAILRLINSAKTSRPELRDQVVIRPDPHTRGFNDEGLVVYGISLVNAEYLFKSQLYRFPLTIRTKALRIGGSKGSAPAAPIVGIYFHSEQ